MSLYYFYQICIFLIKFVIINISNLKINYVTYSEDDARQLVQNRIGSRVKAEKELGFKYKYSLKEGLKALIDWRNDNNIKG